jgi:hypothetical protein
MVRFNVDIPPITAITAMVTVQPVRAYSAAWPMRPVHCWKAVVIKLVISIYELAFAVMREVMMGSYRELNNGTEVISFRTSGYPAISRRLDFSASRDLQAPLYVVRPVTQWMFMRLVN